MEKSTWQIIEEKIPNIKIYLLLVAITIVAYANILPNGFLWDDEVQIVGNQLIQTPGHLREIILSDTGNSGLSGPSMGFYRPLMNFSYWLNYQIFGLNAWGFHLFQLIFHIFNVILVFWVVDEILKRAGISFHQKVSFLTAAIFAVHPGISEAVQYLGAVGEPLFVFFALLSIYKLLQGINYENHEIAARNIVWSSLFAFLAFTAKESAAGIFLIGLLYLYLFVRPKIKSYAAYMAGGAAATLAYFFLRFFVAGIEYSSNHPVPIAKAPLFERLLTIPREILTYLEIFFWPAKLQIYRNFVVRSANFPDFWLPLVIITAIILIVLIFLRKQPVRHQKIYFLFLIFYILFLLPALNIVPLNMTLAERWQYFPAIGLLAIIFLAIFSKLEKHPQKSDFAALLILAILIPPLVVRTVFRDGNWRSGLSLYGHDIRYTGADNANLENNYGVELFRAEQTAEAKTHFARSVALMDDWSVSQNNLGAIYEKEGDLEKAYAHYKRATELSDYYLAYQNMAGILMKTEKYEEAKNFIDGALRKFPTNSDFYFQLAVINYGQGNKPEAQKLLETSLYLNPQNPNAQQLYMSLKNGEEIKFEK